MSDDQSCADDPISLAALKAALPSTLAALHRRQAGLLDEMLIERLVSAGLLRWQGGALEATEAGRLAASVPPVQTAP